LRSARAGHQIPPHDDVPCIGNPSGDTINLVPGDVYEIPPGHDAWVVDDEPVVMQDISVHMAQLGRPAAGERVLATLLFTDVVGPTALLQDLGGTEWKRPIAAPPGRKYRLQGSGKPDPLSDAMCLRLSGAGR
jgi:hypothetical protein